MFFVGTGTCWVCMVVFNATSLHPFRQRPADTLTRNQQKERIFAAAGWKSFESPEDIVNKFESDDLDPKRFCVEHRSI